MLPSERSYLNMKLKRDIQKQAQKTLRELIESTAADREHLRFRRSVEVLTAACRFASPLGSGRWEVWSRPGKCHVCGVEVNCKDEGVSWSVDGRCLSWQGMLQTMDWDALVENSPGIFDLKLPPTLEARGGVTLEYDMVDICFVIDATGSMGSWINQARDRIVNIIDTAYRKHQIDLQVACVAYRDLEQSGEAKQIESKDFVSRNRVNEMKEFIKGLKPDGGGDAPEDIAGGLEAALGLSWSSPSRLCVLIADAPCHGTKYHDCADNHPDGDPKGRDIEDLLQRLCKIGCSIYFISCDPSTVSRRFSSRIPITQ